MRRGALLNDAQLSGILPTSVGGGENADGNWSLMAGICGPGSVMLLGLVALIAPCGGSSGLPKEIAAFSGAAVAAVMVAAVTTPLRLSPPIRHVSISRSMLLWVGRPSPCCKFCMTFAAHSLIAA